MKTKNIFILFVLLSVFLIGLHSTMLAQTANLINEKIHLQTQFSKGKVQLRWAPNSPSLWKKANQKGYQIFRQTIKKGERFNPENFELLTTQSLSPKSLNWFQTAVIDNPENDYLKVIAECLHGEQTPANSEAPSGWITAAEQLKNRFSFALFAAEMDFETAKAAALGFEDLTAKPNEQYIYKVALANSEELIAVYSNIKTIEKPNFQPILANITEEEGRVILHWNRTLHEPHFTAYFIEKSEDGVNFLAINDAPYVHGIGKNERLQTDVISYSTEVENYKQYHYQIRGINAFGELSEPSNVVKAMARDRTPPPKPLNPKAISFGKNQIKIQWDVPENQSDIAGYHIKRAFEYHGLMQTLTDELLSPNNTEFIDNHPNFVGINYYQIIAFDREGNEAESRIFQGFIEDKTPPASPVFIGGQIDTAGIVTINWKENPDPDIRGYRIYFANSKSDVFTSLNNKATPETTFTDTIALRTLSKKIHYRLAAVDKRGNVSPFSKILTLKRPDVIPPAAALFSDYQILEKAIHIQWRPSQSKDVASQVLFRKVNNERWQELRGFTFLQREFQDNDVEAGQKYSYQINTIDETGLFKKSEIITLTAKKQNPDIAQNLKAEINKSAIKLTWQKTETPIKRWIIYRSIDGKPLLTLKNLEGKNTHFEDEQFDENQKYVYALRAVFKDGTRSKMSEKISVN